MRRFIEISIPLLLLLVPEFWKNAFEWLRQSPYWRYAQIIFVLWIVVVAIYPLISYLTPMSRVMAVVMAALIGAVLFGGITLWITGTPKAAVIPGEQPVPLPSQSSTSYAYGLSLADLHIAHDPDDPKFGLQLGLVLRNATDMPLKYEVESLDINVAGMKPLDVRWANRGGVIPRGETQIFRGGPFDRKVAAEQQAQGTIEYSIKYGVADQNFSRRCKKKLSVTVRFRPQAEVVYIIESESDDDISIATPPSPTADKGASPH